MWSLIHYYSIIFGLESTIMLQYIILVVTAIFAVFLVFNLYFRLKLLKLYRILMREEVEFPTAYLLKPDKLKQEIVPKYPHMEKEIMGFSKHMRRSLLVAFIVFVLSLVMGYILIKSR